MIAIPATQLTPEDFPFGSDNDSLHEALGDPRDFLVGSKKSDQEPSLHDLAESSWRSAILSQTAVEFPAPLPLHGSPGVLVHHVYMHRRLKLATEQVFEDLKRQDRWRHITSYSGCYAYRLQRGSFARLSMHAYAAAFDFCEEHFPLGTKPDLSHPFVVSVVPVFRAHGWIWGGTWGRPDGMHVQATRDA